MYCNKKIGERIKTERKAQGYKTQGTFAKAMGLSEYSRQTVAHWEDGTVLPSLKELLEMCNLFDCELGYLLCEHDCKTRENTDIHKVTGLSENAIIVLKKINSLEIKEILITLSKLIEHKKFTDWLRAVHVHIWTFNKNHFRIDNNSIKAISNTLNCKNDEAKEYVKESSRSLIKSSTIEIVEDIK